MSGKSISEILFAIKNAVLQLRQEESQQASNNEYKDQSSSPLNRKECEDFLSELRNISEKRQADFLLYFVKSHQEKTETSYSSSVQYVISLTDVEIRKTNIIAPNEQGALPMTLELLATSAIATLTPYLAEAGEGAAKKIGEASVDAAGKLFHWMQNTLSGRAQESLQKLAAEPESPRRVQALETDLLDALAADPALADALRDLLPPETVQNVQMTQTVTGDNAKAAQVHGHQNTTIIT